MTPVKGTFVASVRVAHSRSCANFNRSALDSLGSGAGCTCKPSFYVMTRVRDKVYKTARVKDRAAAERQRREIQQTLDQRRIKSDPTKPDANGIAKAYGHIRRAAQAIDSAIAAQESRLDRANLRAVLDRIYAIEDCLLGRREETR